MRRTKSLWAGGFVCLAWVLATAAGTAPPAAASVTGEILAGQVSEASYQHYLEDLLYTHLGDDRGFGPEHDLARANIVNELTSLGLDVQLHPFVYDSTTYYNVVGTMTGTRYPDSYFVVGAHFDSANNPGADDNGSGTAAVMEAARVVSQHEAAYTIKFILFDREEQGLIGSSAYVSDYGSDDILGVLNLDMMGHDSGQYAVEIYGRTVSQNLMNDFDTAISAYTVSLGSGVNVGSYAFSDHWPFESAGFPACSTIEWCYWCNPYYHTPQDAVDVYAGYINYAMTTDVVRAVVGFLADYAGVTIAVVPGDFDADGDVDLDDFSSFSACYNGASNPPAPSCPPGVDADLDGDGDVDLDDFAIFAANYTGSL